MLVGNESRLGVNLGGRRLWTSESLGSEQRAMIGVPVEHKLTIACEQRLGRVVYVASVFNLGRVTSPVGNFKPPKALPLVLALTEHDLWLLEFRSWAVGFDVRGVLCRLPRFGLVSQWRHRAWAWPAVWRAELSWPEIATYVTGSAISGQDADRIMGLLAADEFTDACATAVADEGWSG